MLANWDRGGFPPDASEHFCSLTSTLLCSSILSCTTHMNEGARSWCIEMAGPIPAWKAPIPTCAHKRTPKLSSNAAILKEACPYSECHPSHDKRQVGWRRGRTLEPARKPGCHPSSAPAYLVYPGHAPSPQLPPCRTESLTISAHSLMKHRKCLQQTLKVSGKACLLLLRGSFIDCLL